MQEGTNRAQGIQMSTGGTNEHEGRAGSMNKHRRVRTECRAFKQAQRV